MLMETEQLDAGGVIFSVADDGDAVFVAVYGRAGRVAAHLSRSEARTLIKALELALKEAKKTNSP